MRFVLTLFLMITPWLYGQYAHADDQGPISMCQAVAQSTGIIRATYTPAQSQPPDRYQVRIKYIGHSTFRLEDTSGLTIATDYSGNAGHDVIPNVVTMNHAHITHWTPAPDPRIDHVLPGWGDENGPASYNFKVGETIIRNVTTDISSNWVGFEENGNSIFIFEMGGLCIGHLGHLHHLLTDEHYAKIGRLDIVMVPIDGGATMNLPDMVKVVKRLNASMILPMHWFSRFSLEQFLVEMKEGFPVDVRGTTELTVSLNTLPPTATVVVLEPSSSGLFDGFAD